MNSRPELSLKELQKRAAAKSAQRSFRASDFLTTEEKAELKRANSRGRQKRRKFDDIDALGAEICARFGFSAYNAWNTGEFPTGKMFAWLRAERAREARRDLELEQVVQSMVSACIKIHKGERKPRGPEHVKKILEVKARVAREGE